MLEKTKEKLEKLGYTVSCFETKEEACEHIDKSIDNKSVGMGGSMTLAALGIYEKLKEHNEVNWHQMAGENESQDDIRKRARLSDIYISSLNAMTENGELINIDGKGNRVASTIYGHEKVFFVAGKNKIAPDFESAMDRARNIASPKNALRFDIKTPCKASGGEKCFDCASPDRICRVLTVFWGCPLGADVEVVLINEDLGY